MISREVEVISGEEREKFSDLIDEFHDESDRGCAVIAACVLEEMLSKLIKARIPDCGSDELRNLAPPGRLSVAVANGFLLGVLGERNRQEFLKIIKIRNFFAHKPLAGLTFDHHDVSHLCSKLVLCDVFEELGTGGARHRYVSSVVMLYLSMHHELQLVEALPTAPDRGFMLED
nr:hypothetical protein [uncultured Pseudomonas sp.]